ncbi:DoxX family protein [Saccharopolyspora hordei]|uniref:DoxX family protein n=1 Tax=Saccharopolyspora hordei TaxID=1838 RepID=UPI0031B60762
MLATLKAAGAVGLVAGLRGARSLGTAAAVGLVLFSVGAVVAHVRTRQYAPHPGCSSGSRSRRSSSTSRGELGAPAQPGPDLDGRTGQNRSAFCSITTTASGGDSAILGVERRCRCAGGLIMRCVNAHVRCDQRAPRGLRPVRCSCSRRRTTTAR